MELSFKGKIGGDGKISIYQKEKMENQLRNYPNTEVVITFTKPIRNTSRKQKSYWYAAVLPKFHKGLMDVGYNVSLSQTEEFIIDTFLTIETINKEKEGIEKTRYTMDDDIPSHVFQKVVEDMKMYASENLNIFIPEPIK